MKKKNVLAAIAILALVGILFVTGCPDDPPDEKPEEPPKRDTAWLVATWANVASGVEFTIAADLSFTCDLVIPTGTDVFLKARALGKLDFSSSGLGENDFLLTDMRAAAAGVPDASYNNGNELLRSQIGNFNDIKVTLTPNAGKTEFAFSTDNTLAGMFFGGTFTKVVPRDTAWLVATWANAASGVEFTIANDLTFSCDVTVPVLNLKGLVLGKLEFSNILPANDYILTNMRAADAGVPDATYTPGNMALAGQVGEFNNITVTFTPNANRTNFTLSTTSTNMMALMFFSGTFAKQP